MKKNGYIDLKSNTVIFIRIQISNVKPEIVQCEHSPGKGIHSRHSQTFPRTGCGAAELGCSAPCLPRRGPPRSTGSPAPGPGLSSSVAFLQWVHFLDAKHLYLLVLPFERCL